MENDIAVGVAPAPDEKSLGQIGFEAYFAAQGMGAMTSWAETSTGDQTAWHAAAGAVVVEYDRSLFTQAEERAQLLGLEPQPVPEPTPPDNA